MNSRITLPDIVSELCSKTEMTRTQCERFVKSLLTKIADTLVAGENVKVKGLGTFKVSNVEERKSVNINSGAEMIIPGHRKVTFTPDKAISETINEAFAIFEPVELSDDVTEDMLEDEEVTSEKPAESTTESQSQQKTEEESKPEKVIADNDPWEEAVEEQFSEPAKEPVAPESPATSNDTETTEGNKDVKLDTETLIIEAPVVEAPVVEAPVVEALVVEAPVVEAPAIEVLANEVEATVPPISEDTVEADMQGVQSLQSEDEISEDYSESSESHYCHAPKFTKGLWIGALSACIIIFALAIAWRVFLPNSFFRLTHTRAEISAADKLAVTSVPAKELGKISTQPTDTLKPEERIQPVKSDTTSREVAPTQASDTKQTESEKPKEEKKVYDTITKKRFLTTMAKEHYGDYNLWPYIYDENKAILGHPDRIKPGTKVVIPPASKYGIDASNPDCIAKAKKRGAAIYARYR